MSIHTPNLEVQQGGIGKLPTQPEFIRVNAASREVASLDQWVQEGLYHLRRELGAHWEKHYDHRLNHRFIFRPDNSGMTLIGVLRAAMDIHERRFPFAAYYLIPTRTLDALPLSIPCLYDQLFDPLERCIVDAADMDTLVEIKKHLSGAASIPLAPPQIDARYAAFLDEVVCADLGFFPGSSVDQLLSELIFTLSGASAHPRRFSLGIELPLFQPPYARGLEIRFWIELLMILLQWYPPSFSMFWPTGAPPPRSGSLVLTFRQPAGHLMPALMHEGSVSSRSVWRPGLKQAFPGGNTRKGQLPVRPDSTLRHLLLALIPGFPGTCKWYQPNP